MTYPPPVLARRLEDFEWPYPTLRDKLRRLFPFALPPTIKGVDMAPDYQNGKVQDVLAMISAGYLFAIVQVNRGLWVHPNLMSFCAPLFDAGMPVLPYALFYGTISGVDQADFFLTHAQKIWDRQRMITASMLDIEVRDGVTVSTRVTRSEDWFRTVAAETHMPVIKYCSPALNAELLGNAPLGSVIGHVAHWTSAVEPFIPGGWTREQTDLWQIGVATKHSWVPAVPGISGAVDVNKYFGLYPQFESQMLKRYYYSASASPSPSLSPSPSPSMPPFPSMSPSQPEEEMNLTKAIMARDLLNEFIAENTGQQPSPPSSSQSPSPSQAPLPDNVWTMTIKAEQRAKTWTYFVWNDTQGKLVQKLNGENKPMMQEYFDKNGNRVMYLTGAKVDTYKTFVDADGSVNYYKLYNVVGDRGQPLYIAQYDVLKPY